MVKSSVDENRFCDMHMHIPIIGYMYTSFRISLGEVANIVESSVHENEFYEIYILTFRISFWHFNQNDFEK